MAIFPFRSWFETDVWMGCTRDRVPMEPIQVGDIPTIPLVQTWGGNDQTRRVDTVHEGNTSATARNLERVARSVGQKDRWIGVEDTGQA